MNRRDDRPSLRSPEAFSQAKQGKADGIRRITYSFLEPHRSRP